MTTTEHPLVKALQHVEGKAEIIRGEIVHLPMIGYDPYHAALEITVALRLFVRRTGAGHVGGDGLGFIVELPRRMSFSPDAAYFTGPSSGMRLIEAAPDFAVEVRSEGNYGATAERAMAAKRAEYFSAGTRVVWDVDLQSEDVVRLYREGGSDRARQRLCSRPVGWSRTRRTRLEHAGR